MHPTIKLLKQRSDLNIFVSRKGRKGAKAAKGIETRRRNACSIFLTRRHKGAKTRRFLLEKKLLINGKIQS